MTCPVKLSPRDQFDRWHPRECGRKLVDGELMCGMHIKAARRAALREDEDRLAREAANQRERQATERAAKLRELLDVAGGINQHYRPSTGSGLGSYTGGVTLTPEVTDQLIALLSAR